MTRISLFVMVPLMMSMLWHEHVLEGQLAAMARGRDFAAADEKERLIERDHEIDEALWALFGAKPADAIAMVHAVERMPAATPTPASAHSIELAARCVLGEPVMGRDTHPRWPTRESRFCEWQHANASR
ncbi:MAG TPA: hypothetical protein VGL86_13150 [Polyangia bacterium]|jgi:hypothetical protein